MLREVTLSLPEDIYAQIEKIALETKRNIAKVLLDTISSRFPSYPENPDRLLMKREIAAYKTIHSDLVQDYLGQYVAVYQGKLVDNDLDPVALHKRVIANYPDQVVLSRKVQVDSEPVLYMRSPRLERA